MKRVVVKSPGTCGEYIQGWYEGNPCLISSPIDRFSTITVVEGEYKNSNLKPKSQKMVEQIAEKFAIPEKAWQKICVLQESDIPEKKGMASSTADLAGIAAGMSTYFDLGLTPAEIGKLCALIEPSDNLMFPKLNLFNHLSGEVLRKLDGVVETSLVIVDFCGGIDTMSFNETQDDYSKKDLEVFKEIISLFEQGIRNADLTQIGRACTLSAYLNQKRLNKNYLDTMVDLMEECDGLGTIIGHSGTVIGVMYDQNRFDRELFINGIKKRIPSEDYAGIYENRLIRGGVQIEITEK